MRQFFEKMIKDYAGAFAFAFVLIGFIIIIYFLLSSPFNDWSFDRNAELFGQYGDFIGGFIGTVFTLAGFFLLYKTLTTQQEAIAQQDSVSRQDRFEVTFFNLLKNQNDIANDIKAYFYSLKGLTTEITSTVAGHEFFAYSKRELHDIWNSITSHNYLGYYDEQSALYSQMEIDELYNPESSRFTHPDEARESENKILYEIRLRQINKNYGIKKEVWVSVKTMDMQKKLNILYGLYFLKYHYVAGHYFRHLYHILDFAEITKLKQISLTKDPNTIKEISENIQKYVSFVQAQMSSFELMLLFYNALSFPKMLKLVKTYNFLENLAIEDLIDVSHNCIDGINLGSRKDLI
jgi:hypothetical protein